MTADLESNTRYRAVCCECGDSPKGRMRTIKWADTPEQARVDASMDGMHPHGDGWICKGCAAEKAAVFAGRLIERGFPSEAQARAGQAVAL